MNFMTKCFTIQKIYFKMCSTWSVNTHHGVWNFEVMEWFKIKENLNSGK